MVPTKALAVCIALLCIAGELPHHAPSSMQMGNAFEQMP